jgi:hypothetical protein
LSNPRRSLINAAFVNSRHTPYTQSIINVVPQDNRYASIVLAVQVSLRVSPSQEISSCTEMGYIFSQPPLCNNYLESGVMLAVGIDVTTSEVEPKTLIMGHEILSFHAPVVSTFLYCSRRGYHLEVIVMFTL